MDWNVFLSGEIHSDWRQKIIDGCASHNLSVVFTSAVTNHEASDSAGDLLGAEENSFWRDHKSGVQGTSLSSVTRPSAAYSTRCL